MTEQDEVRRQTLLTEKSLPAWPRGKAERISKLLKGKFVLDVGCGAGNLTEIYRKNGFDALGIDLDAALIREAKRKGPWYSTMDFFQMPDSGVCDTIVMADVLEHMASPESALSKAYRVLKPKGTLILSLPAFCFLYSDYDRSIGHYSRWEKEGITALLHRNGFRVKHTEYYDFLGFFGQLIVCRIMGKSTESMKGPIQNAIISLQCRIEDIIKPPVGTNILVQAESLRR